MRVLEFAPVIIAQLMAFDIFAAVFSPSNWEPMMSFLWDMPAESSYMERRMMSNMIREMTNSVLDWARMLLIRETNAREFIIIALASTEPDEPEKAKIKRIAGFEEIKKKSKAAACT